MLVVSNVGTKASPKSLLFSSLMKLQGHTEHLRLGGIWRSLM